MSDPESDDALLQRWSAGDRAAGEVLLRRNFGWLHDFFYAKVNRGADDLIQQTMLACVEQVDRLAEVSSFKAYVLGIARYKLYAVLRERSAARFDPAQTSLEAVLGGVSAGLTRRLEEQALLGAMQRLPIELQLALELKYWQDLSSREIAEVLEISASAVRARIGRAREKLRAELERSASKPAVEAALRLLEEPGNGATEEPPDTPGR